MQQLGAIQKSLRLIEEHLDRPLGLETLARAAGMSFWHFQRTFSAMVGESAGSYLRRRRLAAAALRLRSTSTPLLDLALDCQFESHEAFTRAFKAELGVTPSAYRSGQDMGVGPLPPAILTASALRLRYQHMKLTPEIVTLPPRTFAGLQTLFIVPGSKDANNLKVIPKLWDDFFDRIREIQPLEPGVGYGLSECPEALGLKANHPEEAVYLAGTVVADDAKLPAGMVAWKSRGGLFAKFTHMGRIEKIGETMGFIYGSWLSSGDYQRTEGPDIERYDHTFNPTSDESVLEIFVPVTRGRRPV
ncbi:MAG: GyrI-like domain-containing protein [Opitutaceae bacterium]